MDVIIGIINQTLVFIQKFIAAVTPTAVYISSAVSPALKAFFIFMISIDFIGILTSKIFILTILLILIYIGGYLYLKIYKPQLYEKILDALGLKNKIIKQPFLFETDIDFKVSSN